MADLTNSNVVVKAEFEVGDRFGKSRQEVVKDVTMTLSGHGDGTSGHKIPASAFGLANFYSVDGPLVSSDNTQIVVATPTYDGLGLVLGGALTGSIGSAVVLGPTQFTGTFNGRVRGNIAS